MLDAVSTSRSTTPLSSPSTAPKTPVRSLQDGISSLTHLSTPQKAGLLMGLLSIGAFLLFIFRKFFSNPLKEFPIEVQSWVTKNFKDGDGSTLKHACINICIINNRFNKDPNYNLNLFFTRMDGHYANLDQKVYNKFKGLIILYVKQTYPDVYVYIPESDEEVFKVFWKDFYNMGQTYCDTLVANVRAIEGRNEFLQNPHTYILERAKEPDGPFNMETLALKHYFNPKFKSSIT